MIAASDCGAEDRIMTTRSLSDVKNRLTIARPDQLEPRGSAIDMVTNGN
jgi:hypothetical protein